MHNWIKNKLLFTSLLDLAVLYIEIYEKSYCMIKRAQILSEDLPAWHIFIRGFSGIQHMCFTRSLTSGPQVWIIESEPCWSHDESHNNLIKTPDNCINRFCQMILSLDFPKIMRWRHHSCCHEIHPRLVKSTPSRVLRWVPGLSDWVVWASQICNKF